MSISKNRWIALGAGTIEDPLPAIEEPESSAPTGATRPQLSVPQPDVEDRIPRRDVSGFVPEYWWLGVHGGAGESSLARLDKRTRGAEHHWPMTGSGATVVLVARSNIPGLLAAQRAATEWASGTLPGIRVAGLVVLADTPGRLPKEIRDFAHVVGGGVPHLWHMPWIEAWRFGHELPPDDLPSLARTVLDQIRTAATTAALPGN